MATVYSLIVWGGSAGKSAASWSTSTHRFTLTNNGLRTGQAIVATETKAGLTANNTYYANSTRTGATANEFYLYDTYAQAVAGSTDFRTLTGTTSTLLFKSKYYTDISDATRWGNATPASARIYSGIKSILSARATATGDEVWECGESFSDLVVTGDAVLDINTLQAKSLLITSRVDGVRSTAWHGSTGAVVLGSGYVIANQSSYSTFEGFQINRKNVVIDGISFIAANSYGVNAIRVIGLGAILRNCVFSAPQGAGITVYGQNCRLQNCIAYNSDKNYDIYAYSYFPVFENCGAFNGNYGWYGVASATGTYINCTAVGCTTPWYTENPEGVNASFFTEHHNNGSEDHGGAWFPAQFQAGVVVPATSVTVTQATLDGVANTGVFTTVADHGFVNGDPIRFRATTIPGGLAKSTGYWVRTTVDTKVFHIYDTYANAINTGAITGRKTVSSVGSAVAYTTKNTTNSVYTLTADNSTYRDYAGGDFRPKASDESAPLVNNGYAISGGYSYDILDHFRPSYNPDGTEAWSIGPFEYQKGHSESGKPPITVTFAGVLSGSTIRIFPTGTQTVTASDTNTDGNDYVPAGVSESTYDYTIYKDGYVPIRATGVGFYDGLSTAISQVVDRAYTASSGLSYGTTATVNTSTKVFTIGANTTGQNWYSFWIEQYRQQSDLYNKPFPLQPNGPNSFSLLDGYELDSGDFVYLTRDGIRYASTAGATTAQWAAILTVGVSSGMRVRYQQTDGGTTQQATATSGNMDELIQIYGDSTHGNFDYRSYLVLKVQEMGYDQAEANAVSLYGSLEDQLYVIGLAPTANGIATGNPSLANPPTITDHAGSPITWNSKAFSVTIEDSSAGNSGTDIMRWLRYYFETGGTFQSKDAFNWHDLVQTNGADFKTVRGKLYGDTGATLKGVRVIKNGSTDSHTDFTLHTADDGTTFAPPVNVDIIITNMIIGSMFAVYKESDMSEIVPPTVANTSNHISQYVYTSDINIVVRVRKATEYPKYIPYEYSGTITASGFSLSVSQVLATIA